jgi:hypothetical protein
VNERDWLKSLDRPAPTPPVDVTHSVLADIRRRTPAAADAPDPFLRLFALATGVAAIIIASVATTQLYSVLSNPIQSLTTPLTMVMQ